MAKIAWFASPDMIDFLNNYNIADRLMVAKPGWYKKSPEIKLLRKKLQAYAPDLCLDLQGDMAGRLVAKLSGGGKRISINGKKSRLFGKPKNSGQGENHLEKHLRLLESLNVAGASIDYSLPEIPLERREAAWVFRELGLESSSFALLGVGVQSNSTWWEIDRYVQVAEHLSCTLGLPTVVTWQNLREKRIAEKAVAESSGMVALAPTLSAIQFAALARQSSVFVGTDNDFLHIAAAVGTPCVGVFHDENARRDAPYCSNFQTIQAQAATPRWKSRGSNAGVPPVCIDNYTYDVIQVCNACDDILQPEPLQESLPERQLVGV